MFDINFKSARANIKGSKKYPEINGVVNLKQTKEGVLVTAKIYGLPNNNEECKEGIFGFHIHSGKSCTGNNEDEFANSLSHYNPKKCKHPYHAGDLPPLFSNNGYAYLSVLTDRFDLKEVIGRVIIIHDKPDDFTTQPSGNSGEKIACGKIEK